MWCSVPSGVNEARVAGGLPLGPVYAMPAVALAFLGLPLYVYLPAHYAALPAIGLATVGVVLMVARLVDLVTDPLVGLAADRLRGHLRPQWLMSLGGLLMGLGVWWLFRPAADATVVYLFVALSLTYLGWTLLAIPYYAAGAELGETGGHTRIAAWREGGMIVGTVAALVLPVIATGGDALGASAVALLWLLPPAVAGAWLLRLPCRSPGSVFVSPSGLWRDTSRAARHLLGVHGLNALAGGTAATLFVFFTRDVLALDQAVGGLLLLAYFGAGLLALPLWVGLARRIGDARAWLLAMLVAAVGFLPTAWFGHGDFAGFIVVCLVTGSTLGADVALPAAIQSRLVAAESRVLGRPRGGALFGLWGMVGKLALAVAAGISLPLLAWLSATTGLEHAAVIPWLYAGLPVLIKLAAAAGLRQSALWPHGGDKAGSVDFDGGVHGHVESSGTGRTGGAVDRV